MSDTAPPVPATCAHGRRERLAGQVSDVSSWNALAALAKTPRDVINRLNCELNAVLTNPRSRRSWPSSTLMLTARPSNSEPCCQRDASLDRLRSCAPDPAPVMADRSRREASIAHG